MAPIRRSTSIFTRTPITLSLFESNAEGSPRHSLGSNNSSNFSSPPSPAREHGSSSYES